MSQTTTMTVRVNGTLREFIAAKTGAHGAYENISEYVRDLIRRDEERSEREAFDRPKAELVRAFATPHDSYHRLSAAEVIARNKDWRHVHAVTRYHHDSAAFGYARNEATIN